MQDPPQDDEPPPGGGFEPGPDRPIRPSGDAAYFGPTLGSMGGDAAPPIPGRYVAEPGGHSKPRRRWPWIVLVVLAIGGAGAATLVALDQRDTAELWRDRALALEQQRDEAIERGDALDGQLGELIDVVSASEADVEMLEDRIRELADEKAQAEDAATTVQVERDVVAELTAEIAAATDSLDACVDRLFELQSASVEAFNQSTAGEEVDVEPLNARAHETTQFCNDARTAAARASSAAQQLTTP